MSVTREEVRHIAKLARLKVSEEEEIQLASDLSDVLGYMDILNRLDTSRVDPFVLADAHGSMLRRDEATQRISRVEALRNAPDSDDEYFRVPKVIRK